MDAQAFEDPASAQAQTLKEVFARYNVVQTNNTGLWGKVGRVTKVLAVGADTLLLQDPGTLHTSHAWPYTTVTSAKPGSGAGDFSIGISVGKGKDKVYTFSCRFRAHLLADLHRALAGARKQEPRYYAGGLLPREGEEVPALVGVGASELTLVNARTLNALAVLPLCLLPRDRPGEVLATDNATLVLYIRTGSGSIAPYIISCQERDALVREMVQNAKNNLGLDLNFARSSMALAGVFEQLRARLHVLQQEFAAVASVCDYSVLKTHGQEPGGLLLYDSAGDHMPVVLSVTSTGHLVERSASTYNALSACRLANIRALVRFSNDAQKLGVEYDDDSGGHYLSTARDTLLAILLDLVRWARGADIPILPAPTPRGMRIDPVGLIDASEKTDSTDDSEDTGAMAKRHLRTACQQIRKERALAEKQAARESADALAMARAVTPPPADGSPVPQPASEDPTRNGKEMTQTQRQLLVLRVAQFNACTSYSGLPADSKVDTDLMETVCELLPTESGRKPVEDLAYEQTVALQALRRLVASRSGLQLLQTSPHILDRLFAAIGSGDNGIAADAAHVLTAALRRTPAPYELKNLTLAVMEPSDSNSDIARGHKLGFNTKDMQLEQQVKTSIMEKGGGKDPACATKAAGYRTLLLARIREGVSAHLLTLGLVEVLQCLLCAPYGDTTGDQLFFELLEGAAQLGRSLFRLFTHPSSSVVTTVGLIMKSIAEELPRSAAGMRDAALAEAAVLRHFYMAVFSPHANQRMVSQQLVSIWCDGHKEAMALLGRTLPIGLIANLRNPDAEIEDPVEEVTEAPAEVPEVEPAEAEPEGLVEDVEEEPKSPRKMSQPNESTQQQETNLMDMFTKEKMTETYLRAKETSISAASAARERGVIAAEKALAYAARLKKQAATGMVDPEMWQQLAEASGWRERKIRKRPDHTDVAIRAEDRQNWRLLFLMMHRDHRHSRLLWNERTRVELKEALEAELDYWDAEQDSRGGRQISWNHAEFKVYYKSLANEVMVGEYYLGLLLDGHNYGGGETSLDESQAGKFFSQLYHRLYVETNDDVRRLCVRGMAAIYERYSAEIGEFFGTPHIATLLDTTMDTRLRHLLLLLLRHLLQVPENAEMFMDVEGIELLAQLISTIHEQTDRPPIPLEGDMMIMDSDTATNYRIKRWCYWDSQTKAEIGPLSKAELKSLFEDSRISVRTLCWLDDTRSYDNVSLTGGMGRASAQPLGEIRELRWSVASFGDPVLEPAQLSLTILGMLSALCKQRPNLDKNGYPIRPVPRAQRIMSGQRTLPLIAQTLLCGDPAVVDTVASVLLLIAQYSERVMARLYSTGVYYYALMYTGSNFVSIARLLKYTHCQQHFFGVEAVSSGIPLNKRSVLGNLLPYSMLYALENMTPEEFAQTFTGNSDTPTVIWHHKMRARLVGQIASHLGDFPRLLPECTSLVYDYVPMPTITYPEIKDELWCHKYYLKNLCDTVRFPNFVVVDLVETLQAILFMWKDLLAADDPSRKKGAMSVEEARRLLGVDETANEAKLKNVFRKMALKYHPDKNPEGGPMFQKINDAYELLSADLDGQEERAVWRLRLILESQSILYKRYKQELSPFKYAGYTMLMNEITQKGLKEGFTESTAPVLRAATEVSFYTCVSSPLNGEEIVRLNGVAVFSELLHRCQSYLDTEGVSASAQSGPPTKKKAMLEEIEKAAHYTMLTLAGLAHFPMARAVLGKGREVVVRVIRCLQYTHLPRLIEAALRMLWALSTPGPDNTHMQDMLCSEGLLWHMVKFALRYDPSVVVETVAELVRDKDTNVPKARNYQAVIAASTLYRLDKVPAAGKALSSLLTPYLARVLRSLEQEEDPRAFLDQITTNIEIPQMLWNADCRNELLDFCDKQLAPESRDGNGHCQLSPAYGFRYAAHRREVLVADIFVRIYVAKPTLPIDDPSGYCTALLMYIDGHAPKDTAPQALGVSDSGNLIDLLTPTSEMRVECKPLVLVLRALQILVANTSETHSMLTYVAETNPGVWPVFRCLDMEICQPEGDPQEVVTEALKLVSVLVASGPCTQAVSRDPLSIVKLCRLLHGNAPKQVLDVMQVLSSNAAIVWEATIRGGLLYLLHIIFGAAMRTIEAEEATDNKKEDLNAIHAAKVVAKMAANRTHGPKVVLVLNKYMPAGIVGVMRDSPALVPGTLRTKSNSPELIWNMELLSNVALVIEQQADGFYRDQTADRHRAWVIPEAQQYTEGTEISQRLVIAGIYLDLFLKDPKYPLRNPKGFLEGLLVKYMEVAGSGARSKRDKDVLTIVATATVSLLRVQPTLSDHVASLGYIGKLVGLLTGAVNPSDHPNVPIIDSVISILHTLASSKPCAEMMSTAGGFVRGLKGVIEGEGVSPGSVAASMEILKTLLDRSRNLSVDNLVDQVMQVEFVPFLLHQLEWRALEPGSKPQRDLGLGKIHAIDSLKTLSEPGHTRHSPRIQSILDGSEVWQAYRGQRHDLFLPSTQTDAVAGYLKGAEQLALQYNNHSQD
eukprot:comp22669_c0_seq1/m.35022 comp22669_c0_seq1/g.35022  ORF comp22669_c0_seq1/g.35022 comp22669_c0_seq1/m.35022 type:complete len:2507 (-) comp22669_c0_seq1:101-7621(-)